MEGKNTLGSNPARRKSHTRNAGLSHIPSQAAQTWLLCGSAPRDNLEYEQYSSFLAEEGPLNRGLIFSKPKPDGPAKDRIDLLTVATHEIGHLLARFSHRPYSKKPPFMA
jgi:hypothetical protein